MNSIAHTDDLSAAGLERFDCIIDVRSPAEFAEDHLPGAINLPVLSDEERARIGTHYKQVSPFEARRMGAALTARNIAHHVETTLSDRPKDFKPLIYCWRGGMRSNSMAMVLGAVGWRATLIKGGYRTWREQVSAGLEAETPWPVILIDGQTGTAKTKLLHILASRGEQVIDLEGLARHRGSVFGGFASAEQPSQKAFDTQLWTQMRELDLERPVYVEAESRLVGRRRVPQGLWDAMQSAPRLVIDAPVEARAQYLLTAYPDLADNSAQLREAIEGLKRFHGGETINRWLELGDADDFESLAAELVEAHYDPAYDRARQRHQRDGMETVLKTDALDDPTLNELADQITAAAPSHRAQPARG